MARVLTPDMARAGFALVEPTEVRRVFALTQGPEKCGKTDWALRHSPAPIAVISTDTGTREIVEKFVKAGKEIYLYETKVLGRGREQSEYKREWNKVRKAQDSILENSKIRTYIEDTATEVWDMLRLAEFGKLNQVMPHMYVQANDMMRSMIKDIYRNRPDLNCIFISKQKKQYRESKKGDGKDVWTGKYERSGFDDLRHLADIVLTHYYDMDTREFGIRVVDDTGGVGARATAELAGKEFQGEECSFFWLANAMYPEIDPEYWWDGQKDHPLAE